MLEMNKTVARLNYVNRNHKIKIGNHWLCFIKIPSGKSYFTKAWFTK